MAFLQSFEGILTALGLLIGSVVGSYFVFRGKRGETQVQAAQVNTESASKFLDGQMEFQKYVDDVVRSQVAEATAELRGEVAELATQLASAKTEYDRQSNIIRMRETRLWAWDNIHERQGPMPTLPDEVMHHLGIGHLVRLSAATDAVKIDSIQ